ncbi:MAG TPA: VWA domain-containing protein [Candidatus Angelobacter sp.]
MMVKPPAYRPARFLARLLVLALAAAVVARGQAPASSASSRQPASTDDSTIRVNVRLVNVFTTVTDAHGAPISDLNKEDFKVLEDGVPQTISVFDRESELPLSIVLEVDTSESTRRDLKLEIASAKKFVHSILRPQDRLSLFQISEDVLQLTRYTADMKSIEGAIDDLQKGAGTSLYDGIYLGAETLLNRQGRKVMVLITDGGDTTSNASYSSAVRRAQEAEAIVYSIIIVPVAADAGRNTGGEHALIQISKDTGGKYYYAESIEQLDTAFRQVSQELRTQYLIAYYPNRRLSDSPFRSITVQVNKKDEEGQALQVRHRAGYYSAPAR